MGNLADCLKKLGMTADEGAYFTSQAQLHIEEGVAEAQAHQRVVRDAITHGRTQQRSIMDQIHAATPEADRPNLFPSLKVGAAGTESGSPSVETTTGAAPAKYTTPEAVSQAELTHATESKFLAERQKALEDAQGALQGTRGSARESLKATIAHLQKDIPVRQAAVDAAKAELDRIQSLPPEPPAEVSTGFPQADAARNLAHAKASLAQVRKWVESKSADPNLMADAQTALKERQALVDRYQAEFEKRVAESPNEEPAPPQKVSDGYGGEITLNSGVDPVEAVKTVADMSTKAFSSVKADVERLLTPKPPSPVEGGLEQMKSAAWEAQEKFNEGSYMPVVLKRQFETDVADPARQWAIAKSLEYDNKGRFFDALTPEEQKVAQRWDGLLKKANEFYEKEQLGPVLEKEEGFQHIFHHWTNPKSGEAYPAGYGRLTRSSPMTKERTVADFTAGETKGLKPATVNPGELIGLQIKENMRLSGARTFAKEVSAMSGDPSATIPRANGVKGQVGMVENWLDLIDNGLADDYVKVEHRAFERPIKVQMEDGTMRDLRGPLGVRKEIAPHFKAFIADPQWTTFDRVLTAARGAKLAGSFFHVHTLAWNNITSGRAPLEGVLKGGDLIMSGDPTMKLLVKEGLKIEGYQDFAGMKVVLKLPTTSEYATMRVGAQAANVLTYIPEKMIQYTFGVIQPRLKATYAYQVFNDMLPKYLEAGLTKEQAARDAVKHADQRFSGEDVKLAMLETNKFMANVYFSQTAQKAWQRSMISAVWQREHLLADWGKVKSVLPDKLVEKAGFKVDPKASQVQYQKWIMGVAATYAAANLYNYLMTGYMDGESHVMIQNPPNMATAIRAPYDSPAYEEITDNGQVVRHPSKPVYFRPWKSLFEVPHMIDALIHGDFSVAWNKLNPFVSATIETAVDAKDSQKGWEGIGTVALKWGEDAGLPIPATTIKRVVQGKESPLELPTTILGVPAGSPNVKDERPYYMDWMLGDREGKDKALQKMKEAGITFNSDRPMSIKNDAEGKVKALLLNGDENGAATAVEEWNNTMTDQRYRIYLSAIKAEMMKANSSRQRKENKSKAIQ